MLVCRYLNQNFVRVHYFVRVEYSDPALNDVPPPVVDVDKVHYIVYSSAGIQYIILYNSFDL